jgi:hypothetical protein
MGRGRHIRPRFGGGEGGGSLFKPDVIIMSFDAACRFCNIERTRTPTVSRFIGETPTKVPTKEGPKANPSSHVGWKDVLSAVEIKRGPKEECPYLDTFLRMFRKSSARGWMSNSFSHKTQIPQRLQMFLSPEPVRFIHPLINVPLKDCTVVTSKSAESKKRTASEARISSGVPSTDSKRQRGHPKTSLLTQAGTYAGEEKLSDSHSVRHVVNLLVQGENRNIRARFTQLTPPAR